jgi:hypothetical protein
MEVVKVLVQIGKATKGFGHMALLMVRWNKVLISWNNTPGEWATAYAEKRRQLWYVAEIECSPKDTIEIESFVKTNDGIDEKMTWKRIYEVDPEEEVLEVREHGSVGHRNFPILKGRVREVMSYSKHDRRMDEILGLFESL